MIIFNYRKFILKNNWKSIFGLA